MQRGNYIAEWADVKPTLRYIHYIPSALHRLTDYIYIYIYISVCLNENGIDYTQKLRQLFHYMPNRLACMYSMVMHKNGMDCWTQIGRVTMSDDQLYRPT